MLRPRNDERVLTRAMTPEINTVGLGGLEDKKEKTWTTMSHREEHTGDANGETDFMTA